jgi:TolB-like protein/pimeloyl-ACP methyl ester carboxylesterase/Tfp pilus assembly protein PilF
MGEVYRAHDDRLGRDVAVKLLSPDVSGSGGDVGRRFEREARVVARLNHPNVLTLYDVGDHDGALFLVTELLEGTTLRQRLDRGALPWHLAVRWAADMADGLAAAHDLGIVHRDLKPENVWITDDDRVKILDFGIAKVIGPQATEAATTLGASEALTGQQVLGTIWYMSPEQIHGGDVDARSDIFSLGAVLYEMLAGRRPFERDTPIAVLHAIVHDEPAPVALPPGCPAAVAGLVARCLAKTPRLRFGSARDLAFALQALKSPATVAGAALADAPPRVAILPFADLSPLKDQDYWCEGIAEELISALSASSGLQVVSRQASFRAAASGLDGRAAGVDLGVSAVVEGTIRRAEGHLRITARLLDVAAGHYTWSQAFERAPGDVFAIEEEIVRQVSRTLGVSRADDSSSPRLPTTDVEAYDLYLRARQQLHRMRRDSLEAARHLFRRVIHRDPSLALAYAGVAEASVWLYVDWGGRPEDLVDAEDASWKAVGLAQQLAEAHLARALTLSAGRQWPAAELEFETALRLQPQLYEARYFYGRSWVSRGNLTRAAQWFERAAAVRPESEDAWILLAMSRLAVGTRTQADEALRRALQAAERHLHQAPDEIRPLALGAQALAALGDRPRAIEWAKRAEALAGGDAGSLYNVGAAYATAGDLDAALACLEPAIDRCTDLEWVDHDALLDAIRTDPRFLALVEAAWRRRGGRRAESPTTGRIAPSMPRAGTGGMPQRIGYCTTRDQVRIAYAQTGQGPLLVRVLGWFTHLEMEWAWPDLRALWERLSAHHTVVRYDGRGIGLSDRWAADFTEETRERDLDAVLDAVGASPSRPAALLGISEGGWTGAACALRHPDRISHLIVYGGYARGALARPGFDAEEDRALLTLMRKGWGRETSAFRQVFTSQFYRDDADPELLAHFNDLQRGSADPETAARYVGSCHLRGDGTSLFARLTQPLLVIHRRGDRSVPFEEGRYLASVVPGARFLPLPGSAHYFPTARSDDPGTAEMIEAIENFVALGGSR